MKIFKRLGLGLAAAMLSVSATAGNIGFDEGALQQTGNIAYAGFGGSLIGSGIIFSTILGSDTPSNTGVSLDCLACELSFNTGPNVSEGPSTWLFGSGGNFNITGTAMNGATQIATGLLLTGSFSGPSLVLGGGGTGLFVGQGFDTKHDDLEAFFGYPADQPWNFAATTLSVGSCVAAGGSGGFNCGVLNADVNNVSRVPIPGTAALLLFGLGMTRRRKSV
jgi:hypothetical protein